MMFQNKSVVNLMFAAHSGDVSALRRSFYALDNVFLSRKNRQCYLNVVVYFLRFALSSMDMGLNDYDARTPLHVASAEGYSFTFTYIFRNGVIFSLQNAFCV